VFRRVTRGERGAARRLPARRQKSSQASSILGTVVRRPDRRFETHKETTMRFMVLVKANKDSEAGVLPDEKILTAMGKFNEELVKAGVMLAGEGLQPSSKGTRVRFEGNKKKVAEHLGISRSYLYKKLDE